MDKKIWRCLTISSKDEFEALEEAKLYLTNLPYSD